MSNIINLENYRAPKTPSPDSPEARFGRWQDWSAGDIFYLLHELSDGHWQDCGQTVRGFAVAMGGINMAIAANESALDDDGLNLVINGMWVAADYLHTVHCDENTNPRIRDALATVWEATRYTGVAAAIPLRAD